MNRHLLALVFIFVTGEGTRLFALDGVAQCQVGQVGPERVGAAQAGTGVAGGAAPLGPPDGEYTLTIRADSQAKVGDLYRLRGNVEIIYGEMTLRADEASYDAASGEVVAYGGITFKDPHADLKAGEAHYHLPTRRGWFSDVEGYLQPQVPPDRLQLSSPTPFFVRAQKVERLNENTFVVHGARVTSCAPGELGWSFSASRATIKPGDRVALRNPLLRLGALPIFYLPYAAASIAPKPRRSGFLLPQFGTSSQKGVILGEAFYWAINRSADLTIGVQNFSIRGIGSSAEFRARPSRDTEINVNYFRVDDKGTGPERQLRAPGQSLRLTGESADLFNGFRAVADVDYISSLAFRSTFTDNFSQAVRSEVRSIGFLSNNFGPYSFNAYVSRYQNFLSAELVPDNSVVIRRAPSFTLSGRERQVGRSPFYFSFDGAVAGVGRSEPGFESPALVQRTDLFPRLTLRTKAFHGFRLTPQVGLRATRYSSSRAADRSSVVRLLGDFSLDLRPPPLEKVFAGKWLSYRFKHVFEPQIQYRLVRARDRSRIDEIIRFDQVDTFAETHEIEYSVTNRIFFRRGAGNGEETPQARELLSWRLSQKYFFDPTFGNALRPRERVVFEPTNSLTGFAFATGRRLSPLVSVLKFSPFSNYDTEIRADFSPSGGGVLNAGITSNVRRGGLFLSVTDFFINKSSVLATRSLSGLDLSTLKSFHLLRGVFGFGDTRRRGLSGAFGADYNFSQGEAHQTIAQITYNFGCFGVDLEYRRFALGPLRRENQIRFSLSLSNIGSFGNIGAHQGLY